MQINELVKKAHENAVNKGFWEDAEVDNYGLMLVEHIIDYKGHRIAPESINAVGNRLMLIVGEVAEAQEGLRHNDMDNFREELADVAIRLGDLCGGLGIDLEAEIIKKMEYNKTRPFKHGKQF